MRKNKGGYKADTEKKKGKSPIDCAFDFMTVKARTVRETEDHLDQYYGEQEVYDAVERLKELGYLNDEKYAADFIETRLATKPVSRQRLFEQLYLHKISKEIIENAILAISDETESANAKQVAEKFAEQFEEFPDREKRIRISRRLMSRGFSFDTIRECVNAICEAAGDDIGDECFIEEDWSENDKDD